MEPLYMNLIKRTLFLIQKKIVVINSIKSFTPLTMVKQRGLIIYPLIIHPMKVKIIEVVIFQRINSSLTKKFMYKKVI
ncbi:hypothetical protein DQK38_24020 [Salmonella enterica subsp. houtenae]|nr:hypothetical protein [Salmonella enterica subsp. houtenae]